MKAILAKVLLIFSVIVTLIILADLAREEQAEAIKPSPSVDCNWQVVSAQSKPWVNYYLTVYNEAEPFAVTLTSGVTSLEPVFWIKYKDCY